MRKVLQKNNTRTQIIMAGILLIIVSIVAINLKKIIKKTPDDNSQKNIEMTTILHNGKSVVIDPGHGGNDPGKVGVSGTLEKDINLQIALKLKELLSRKGYHALLTRDTDVHLGENEKYHKTSDLNKRLDMINLEYENNQNTIMISIHQNSFVRGNVHGAQCFYYANSDKSKKLAESIQSFLNQNINTHKERMVKSNRDYYMLLNSKCPGVIVECGFLSNPTEETKLKSDTYQEKMVEMIERGIDEYFKE